MELTARPATDDDSLSERINAATQRLTVEFKGRFTPQAIHTYTQESLQSYAQASVLDYVPLFVERFTRERLKRASVGQPHA